jgi:hypothetical protein
MEDLTLTVQKRAFPSTGRGRVNAVVLKELGVEDREEIYIGTVAKDRWITIAAFGDSTVGVDTIRLSTGDLAELGVEEGTSVVVKTSVPLSDQVRQTAHEAAGQLAGGLERIMQTVEPVAAKAQVTAQEVYSRVSQDLPSKDEIGRAIDAAKKKIAPKFAPDDAGTLLTLLYQNKGAIRAVIIPLGKETAISALGLPEGVSAIAFRRGESGLVVPAGNSRVMSGDQLFLIGDEDLLALAIQKIGV